MPFRDLTFTVRNCPLGEWAEHEDCKKCPYHEGMIMHMGRSGVDCGLESESEKKMKPEPVKDVEFKSRW